MTYPPNPPGWGWPPPPPYAQNWPHGSNPSSSHDLGEIRERLAILETDYKHLVRAVHTQHGRLMTGDQRFVVMEAGMRDMRTDIAAMKQPGESSPKPRAWWIVEHWRTVKEVLQWGAAIVALALIAIGKMTGEQGLGLLKLVGIG